MDDFDLRDLLSPPLRHCAEEMEQSGQNTPAPAGGMVLAMAYVPVQSWQALYDTEEALTRGTLFRELDFPFEGRPGR